MLITLLLLACGNEPNIHVSEQLGAWTPEVIETSDTKYINFWVEGGPPSGSWSVLTQRKVPGGISTGLISCDVYAEPNEAESAAISAWNVANSEVLTPPDKVGLIQCKLGDKNSTSVLQVSDIWLLKE